VSAGPFKARNGQTLVQTPQGRKYVTVYRRMGFWEYFHFKAVNWTWKKEHSNDKEPEPVGAGGYFFVLLGIVGFSLSGLIAPAILAKVPYCDLCERYMRMRLLAVWPASQTADKSGHPTPAAADRLRALAASAQAADAQAFRAAINQTRAQRKAADKLQQRMRVRLVKCPSCSTGWLQPAWVTGQGKRQKITPLTKIEMTPEFIRQIS
jgi:hypothetical protein